MSKNETHLISKKMYEVLYLVKLLQNGSLSYNNFRACIEQQRETIQKLKRTTEKKNEQ